MKRVSLLLLLLAFLSLSMTADFKPTKLKHLDGSYPGKLVVKAGPKVVIDSKAEVTMVCSGENKAVIKISGVEYNGKPINLSSEVTIVQDSSKNKFKGAVDIVMGTIKIPAIFEGYEQDKVVKATMTGSILVIKIEGEFIGKKVKK